MVDPTEEVKQPTPRRRRNNPALIVEAKAESKEDKPYWEREWGGNVSLQCKFCPWDTIGSPTEDYDIYDRMNEHQALAKHDVTATPTYGRGGLPV